jgi:WD40 repeat protein
VTSLAFASDGGLAVGTSGNQNGIAVPGLQLWTASQPASFRLARVAASATRVSSVAFSRDGRLLAAAIPAGALILDVSTGRPADVIATGGSAPSVAFSPTSTDMLATAGAAGAQLWNIASRRLIATIEPEPATAGLSLDSVAFSPDGATLAVGTGRAIQLWNVAARSQESSPIATGDVGPNGWRDVPVVEPGRR